MWQILRIDEDDYGCEERAEDEALMCLVTVTDGRGETRCFSAEDDFLTEHGLEEGDIWPEDAPLGQDAFPV